MIPDFQIDARFRAGRLTITVPPDGRVEAEEGVEISRDEIRRGLGASVEPGKPYENVEIETKVVGLIARSDAGG